MPRTTLLRKQVTPTGTIQPHAGPTAPDGFLVCDGSIVNIADYPKLYAVIGTSWGHGNEVSPGVSDGLTFHLPDLRGRFLRGVDNPSGIPGEEAGRDPDAASRAPSNDGGNSGDAVGSVQGDAIRNITGYWEVNATYTNAPVGSGAFSPSGPNSTIRPSPGIGTNLNRRINFNAANVVPTTTENRPININVNYVIKAV